MQPLWKTAWKFLKKLKIKLPYDLAIPLLTAYLKKRIIRKDICTPVFIAVLFTVAKIWKQSKYPSKDEQIKKRWFIHTIEYYSAMRKKEVLPFATMLDGP